MRLAAAAPQAPSDLAALENLAQAAESFAAEQDIVSEGDRPRAPFVVCEGLACQYRMLEDGTRQVLSFLIPGDICGLQDMLEETMDHGIAALSPVSICGFPVEDLVELGLRRPQLAALLWRCSSQAEAILREGFVAVGRRDGRQRVAHILCEFLWRYQAVGLVENCTFKLPLTQIDLADALGLTPVHISRVMKLLRSHGMLAVSHRTVHVLDPVRLQALARFTPEYLRLRPINGERLRAIERFLGRARPSGPTPVA